MTTLEFNSVTKMHSRFGLILAFPTNKFFVVDSKQSLKMESILRDENMTFSDSLTPLSGSSPVGLWHRSCYDGSLLWDRMIIQDLGNFSMIRPSAKCAARIGQAFSDTRTAVPIDTEITRREPDVTFNSRVFSDGVGIMSYLVMYTIWDKLPKARLVKPTLFQIRFQGMNFRELCA
jgi:hypothetical protein